MTHQPELRCYYSLRPAVGAGGPPQLVRGVKGLSAPQQLDVELDASQVVRGHQVGLVARQGVMFKDKLTCRKSNI